VKAGLEGTNKETLKDVLISAVSNFEQDLKAPLETYATLVASLASLAKENPTEAEKTAIIQKIKDFQKADDALTKSEPGLENALSDPIVKSDPKNREFFQQLQLRDIGYKHLEADPAMLYKLAFIKDGVAQASHTLIVVADFISRWRNCKLKRNYYCYYNYPSCKASSPESDKRQPSKNILFYKN
jgi:hypothetical protein